MQPYNLFVICLSTSLLFDLKFLPKLFSHHFLNEHQSEAITLIASIHQSIIEDHLMFQLQVLTFNLWPDISRRCYVYLGCESKDSIWQLGEQDEVDGWDEDKHFPRSVCNGKLKCRISYCRWMFSLSSRQPPMSILTGQWKEEPFPLSEILFWNEKESKKVCKSLTKKTEQRWRNCSFPNFSKRKLHA